MKLMNSDPDLDDFGTNVPSEESIANLPPEPPEDCSPAGISIGELMEDLGISNGDNSKNRGMKFTQWTTSGPGTMIAVPPTIPKLHPGVYTMEIKHGRIHFRIKDLKVDDLLRFPDSQADKIMKEINSFWRRGKTFKEYGFLHRRGYLLYGPQGSGKTALIQQVVADIIREGGIVFICENPGLMESGLEEFRGIEKNRPVVCLFEDIDAIVSKHGEDNLLSLLDGETQIDKVLNIASTNYPERLDKRIVSRPRRFDRILKIGMPNEQVRRVYFEKKLNIKSGEIDTWVKATEGFSFAACAELVISVKCLDIDFDRAVSILKKLMENKTSSSDFDEKIGFKTDKPGFAGLIEHVEQDL